MTYVAYLDRHRIVSSICRILVRHLRAVGSIGWMVGDRRTIFGHGNSGGQSVSNAICDISLGRLQWLLDHYIVCDRPGHFRFPDLSDSTSKSFPSLVGAACRRSQRPLVSPRRLHRGRLAADRPYSVTVENHGRSRKVEERDVNSRNNRRSQIETCPLRESGEHDTQDKRPWLGRTGRGVVRCWMSAICLATIA